MHLNAGCSARVGRPALALQRWQAEALFRAARGVQELPLSLRGAGACWPRFPFSFPGRGCVTHSSRDGGDGDWGWPERRMTNICLFCEAAHTFFPMLVAK
jgi:hypothetical protein